MLKQSEAIQEGLSINIPSSRNEIFTSQRSAEVKPTDNNKLIDIDINVDSFKKVISVLQRSLDDHEIKISRLNNIIRNTTRQYTSQLEDLGYEEGTLQKMSVNMESSNHEAIIRNQAQTFCLQLKSIIREMRDLKIEVEKIDNQKKQFDYRISYLESASKNIVTQTEYRLDTIKLEERVQAKANKSIDGVFEELTKQK